MMCLFLMHPKIKKISYSRWWKHCRTLVSEFGMLDGSQNTLKLYYGTNDAEAWLSAAEAAMPEVTVDNNDTSGL